MLIKNCLQRAADIPIDGFDPPPNAAAISACHPEERFLLRYASNETGAQARKKLARHLECCRECRIVVRKFRDVSRKFRDLERVAIAAFNGTGGPVLGRM